MSCLFFPCSFSIIFIEDFFYIFNQNLNMYISSNYIWIGTNKAKNLSALLIRQNRYERCFPLNLLWTKSIHYMVILIPFNPQMHLKISVFERKYWLFSTSCFKLYWSFLPSCFMIKYKIQVQYQVKASIILTDSRQRSSRLLTRSLFETGVIGIK